MEAPLAPPCAFLELPELQSTGGIFGANALLLNCFVGAMPRDSARALGGLLASSVSMRHVTATTSTPVWGNAGLFVSRNGKCGLMHPQLQVAVASDGRCAHCVPKAQLVLPGKHHSQQWSEQIAAVNLLRGYGFVTLVSKRGASRPLCPESFRRLVMSSRSFLQELVGEGYCDNVPWEHVSSASVLEFSMSSLNMEVAWEGIRRQRQLSMDEPRKVFVAASNTIDVLSAQVKLPLAKEEELLKGNLDTITSGTHHSRRAFAQNCTHEKLCVTLAGAIESLSRSGASEARRRRDNLFHMLVSIIVMCGSWLHHRVPTSQLAILHRVAFCCGPLSPNDVEGHTRLLHFYRALHTVAKRCQSAGLKICHPALATIRTILTLPCLPPPLAVRDTALAVKCPVDLPWDVLAAQTLLSMAEEELSDEERYQLLQFHVNSAAQAQLRATEFQPETLAIHQRVIAFVAALCFPSKSTSNQKLELLGKFSCAVVPLTSVTETQLLWLGVTMREIGWAVDSTCVDKNAVPAAIQLHSLLAKEMVSRRNQSCAPFSMEGVESTLGKSCEAVRDTHGYAGMDTKGLRQVHLHAQRLAAAYEGGYPAGGTGAATCSNQLLTALTSELLFVRRDGKRWTWVCGASRYSGELLRRVGDRRVAYGSAMQWQVDDIMRSFRRELKLVNDTARPALISLAGAMQCFDPSLYECIQEVWQTRVLLHPGERMGAPTISHLAIMNELLLQEAFTALINRCAAL